MRLTHRDVKLKFDIPEPYLTRLDLDDEIMDVV